MEQEETDVTPRKIFDFSGNPNVELDLPPEYCHYRDDGCEFADNFLGYKSSCLNCPFPECVYDKPRGGQRWLKKLQAREIVRLFTTEGKGVKEIARQFGVSQRTVQRALKRTKYE